MTYTHLLLDADGTLFDYDKAEASALARTFARCGLPYDARCLENYRAINERMWLAFERGEIEQEWIKIQRFEELLAELGLEADAAAFSADYLTQLGAAADLVEGALEVVRELHERVPLVLITNGLAAVQRSRLALSGLEGYFRALVISEEIGASKPDRHIFDVAFAHMGTPPKEEVLIVGDSLTSDMAGGIAYGIDTCWYNPAGLPHPAAMPITHVIRRLPELLELVPEAER